MKILWLSHLIPYPPKGGVLQRSYYLLRELAQYHEVHLLAFNQKDLIGPLFPSVEQGIKEAEEHLSGFCKSIQFLPVPVDRSGLVKKFTALRSLFTRFPYTLNWLLSDEYSAAIRTILKREKFDYVHFDTISLAPFKELCANLPTSLDHHNIESHMLIRRASKESNWLKKLYFYQEGKRLEKYEKLYCPQFTFNFTCSDVDSQRLRDITPDSQVHTVPNGVDITYFTPEPPATKQDRLIFAGTMNWYPNIEAVNFITEKIWPGLKNKHPNTGFDLIGANPPAQLIELSRQDPDFSTHGFVDDVRPYFRQAKCYVCPIKDGGGTKLKILDALAMGMAIIADPIACEGIDVSNHKNVIFAETPEQYVDAILKVLSDDELREGLEQKARTLATDKYSYRMIGKLLSELYEHYQQAV